MGAGLPEQARYTVQIADLAYHPYISNFNDVETAPDSHLKYRWSKADPEVFLPGVGNQPVELSITTTGSRPGGPPPEITLTVRGKLSSCKRSRKSTSIPSLSSAATCGTATST